ncbi:RNA 2',3'-cyclic phosphodiesterase [Aliikangiella marina]|uniref:RNA 2',3'-cyclic phosphodiesterase n=1 Tax=Aliikangiella marina TaxID=1712262 RepID=UPI00163D5C24|nr:RNA 2',3'-cyclic phosphodiesterase [Aliikangiella marina]
MRLFFAIELEPNIKSKLLTIQDRVLDVNGTAVPGENFHITLSFLGKVAERELESILDGLSVSLHAGEAFSDVQVSPFSVTLNQLTYWPKPKIIAALIDDQSQGLGRLKKSIESVLTSIGHFQFDRKSYKPHVTLFRHVDEPPKHLADLELTVAVKRFSLLESVQGRHGVNYHMIESWPLKQSSIKQQLLGL